FTVSDGTAAPDEATISITVNPVNDDPLANAQSLATDEDAALPVTLTGGDVDGDSLVFVITGGPGNGQLTGTAPNLTYTPNANYHGGDSFIFTVSDGTAAPVEATVTITVHEVGGTPFAEWIGENDISVDPFGDADGDSIGNVIEYVIGGNPVDGVDTGMLPFATVEMTDPEEESPGDGRLVFTYRSTLRAKNDAMTSVDVEWCVDPGGAWTLADGTHGELTEVAEGAAGEGIDLVRVSIPMSPEGRLFARLKVVATHEPTE
ncbi:MAG: Ig-like domain-containing protein, partial [Luteolibacter sp.]|nr:Ig-like domain-containing protein [Luteolibacter sp.]